ncbi:uncharacterized protein LOC128088632 isoform X1 [Tympanuchus pallidicinctus]|uniref:uncharacterized protein LOC128088632 isoform X1 n=1 Tax=Tympanuchus pallidicinctus TaxID=109042 RepID=UPI002287300D|nr:uncharacterized protein LOC128088632 isoform X1 [Tympanuchus pallidicinctus]XP_052555330.1 uncharacterized protein LOC128088632 isoform X1 [Tympanuchus pallidicinctus]XP_052555331.1 uncharacterized protein LOC128088632 isoform X1 [Tympanuchus pallidicinctus]
MAAAPRSCPAVPGDSPCSAPTALLSLSRCCSRCPHCCVLLPSRRRGPCKRSCRTAHLSASCGPAPRAPRPSCAGGPSRTQRCRWGLTGADGGDDHLPLPAGRPFFRQPRTHWLHSGLQALTAASCPAPRPPGPPVLLHRAALQDIFPQSVSIPGFAPTRCSTLHSALLHLIGSSCCHFSSLSGSLWMLPFLQPIACTAQLVVITDLLRLHSMPSSEGHRLWPACSPTQSHGSQPLAASSQPIPHPADGPSFRCTPLQIREQDVMRDRVRGLAEVQADGIHRHPHSVSGGLGPVALLQWDRTHSPHAHLEARGPGRHGKPDHP